MTWLIRPLNKHGKKDVSEFDCLVSSLQNPYSDQPGMDAYAAQPPNWGKLYQSVARLKPSRRPGILYAPIGAVFHRRGARLTVLVGS